MVANDVTMANINSDTILPDQYDSITQSFFNTFTLYIKSFKH